MKNIILLIIPTLLFISCDTDSVSNYEYEYSKQESLSLNLTIQTKLIIENTNGSITITASDTTTTLQAEIRKKVKSKISESDAESHISEIKISTQQSPDDVRMSVTHPNNDDRNYEINLDIILPNNFNYYLTLGNGSIDVNAETKNINLSLGNGTVEADLVLTDNCDARITVGNGTIEFTIPNNTNSMLVASVGNGSIINNGLSFQNQQATNKTFTGKLGNGNGNIVLISGNGTITMSGN